LGGTIPEVSLARQGEEVKREVERGGREGIPTLIVSSAEYRKWFFYMVLKYEKKKNKKYI